ncbi:sensor histidine kinase [Streptomyces flavofungini]|uniref:sensor histidine kinase n=1 Tax=Streptomyces flavofungini TaxID=68200 RepID=UPI0025B1AA3C|nr:nitrate- and nitrite sensing domain-containing protein [Streptomyces flavofungini]WJV44497.1 nitrate- and nitrite sensing domain-containing protein [Streptomyces flavofungini]
METPRTTPETGSPPPSTAHARGRRAHAGPPAQENRGTEEPRTDRGPVTAPRATRWRLRPRTVRAKVVCLLMVPVVSLLALWAFATVSTAQDVVGLRQTQRVDSAVRAPVVAAVTALQAERAEAVRYATKPAADRAATLKRQAERTDQAVAKLRLGEGNTVADGAGLPAPVADRLAQFVTGAERLRTVRTSVLDRRTGWDAAYGQYTRAVTAAFKVNGALSAVQSGESGSHARVLLEFSRAGEMLAREDALLASARLAGTFDGERLRRFTGAADTRQTLVETAAADLRGPERAAWQRLVAATAYADVTAAEDKVLLAEPGEQALAAAPAGTWDTAHATVLDRQRAIADRAARDAADRADPLARGVFTAAGAAVFLGLVAVVASLVISVRIGRGLVVELVGLRNRALEIARRQLPHAIRKLRAGEDIDIDAEAPQGPRAEDETGQVAEALGTVHRAALRAAVERAELASGISGVFVNLARRSQVLVHRQLNLLDTMERRADDPNELGDLFRLDHLTTRMRRHAESLIILSGAAPGRAWRMPVPLTNVVRAALSEVEDYARVEVRQLPSADVVGAAVADLTHLLAELVENAAQFSPPHTKVRVSGEPVGNGYALEIEDRGLGMGAEVLVEANRRVTESEALDLFDSDQLGLFVVSRLAARHNIKVHLRTSPYGGTTAVVLLPTALLHSGTTEPRAGRTSDRQEPEETRVNESAQYAAVGGAASRDLHLSATAERPVLGPPTDPGRPASPPPGITSLHLRKQTEGPPPETPDVGTTDVPDDLPRRVRQASLAPQLRGGPPTAVPGAADAGRDNERSPEHVRDRIAAYRDGWARGGGRLPGVIGAVPDPDGTHRSTARSEGELT